MKEWQHGRNPKLMLWHALSVVLATWTACYALLLLPDPDLSGVDEETARACRIRMNMRILYLSSWNYVAYGIFGFLSFAHDVFSNRILARFLDWLYTTYVLPFSLLVSTVFWLAQSVSPTLLVPPPLSPLLTPFLNHTVHSSVAFGVMLELLMRPIKFPDEARRRKATVKRHKLLLSWQILSYILYAATGVFMYPINGMFGWPLCLLLDLLMHFLLLAADFIPRTLAHWWWSEKKGMLLENLQLDRAATICQGIMCKGNVHRTSFGF